MNNIIISFLTPKKVALNGIWLGDNKADTVYIFLHGLGGSLFSRASFLELLASQKKTAVLSFNNRGFGLINSFKVQKNKIKKEFLLAGMAHEKFTDCIDDISGAINYVRTRGVKKIILLGHSTGCQKIVYYLSKNPRAKIQAAVLLAPMSDYASIDVKNKDYIKALRAANKLKQAGRENSLLAPNLWPYYISAQRFLSLYTENSVEEIFSYYLKKNPQILKKVNQAVLIFLAEHDAFRNREIKEIKEWFDCILKNKKNYSSIVIKEAQHSFEGKDKELLMNINKFLK